MLKKIYLELRRREVFRTAGLYVGVAWIVIEVASVLLPTFDLPDETLRWLVILAVVGFPISLVLAYIFDVTDQGIVVQGEATESVAVPVGGRTMDFVVIGVLSIALVVSLYINFTTAPELEVEPDLATALIADFDNRTGNPLFDGALEQALAIGLEGAPFIDNLRRDEALQLVQERKMGSRLDAATARQLSIQEELSLVLAPSIEADGQRLNLQLLAIDAASGEEVASASSRANNPGEVLTAIYELAAELREDLGDSSSDLVERSRGESTTTGSIEAMKAFSDGQQQVRAGRDEEAIEHFRKAVELDPQFARAWSAWGLSAFNTGRDSEAKDAWAKALALQDRMTEHERFRTLGLYYSVISPSYDKAIDNFRQLTQKFPADGAGIESLAALYALKAQYDRALEQSGRLLAIHPKRLRYRVSHAQYALYAGDLETAESVAKQLLKDKPGSIRPYLIAATVALGKNDSAAALGIYESLAKTGERGASLAITGQADIALFERRIADAVTLLAAGIEADRAAADERGVATKTIALAQAQVAQEDAAEALRLLSGLENARQDGQFVPMAEIYAAKGMPDEARQIADHYRGQSRPKAAAYAGLIDGLLAYQAGDYNGAIGKYRKALAVADLWLLRFHLGQAYLAADYPVEASSEFAELTERRGEAGDLFAEDVPTWRYVAELAKWKAASDGALSGPAVAPTP